jgi:hypothetical protein
MVLPPIGKLPTVISDRREYMIMTAYVVFFMHFTNKLMTSATNPQRKKREKGEKC